jgi:hypothetical protein
MKKTTFDFKASLFGRVIHSFTVLCRKRLFYVHTFMSTVSRTNLKAVYDHGKTCLEITFEVLSQILK